MALEEDAIWREKPAHARLLLVEDDAGLGELIAAYLALNGFDVHWIRRGDTALEALRAHAPDVMLLDVMLPGLDGFGICREVRARGLSIPILMLTARDEDFDRVLGLELGADEFLAKPVQPRVLLAYLRAILRRAGMGGPTGGSADSLRFGSLEIDVAARSVRLRGRAIELTSSEFDLLCLLARRAGTVLSRNDILNQLRSLDYDGTDRSVDCRIYRLRRKLGDFSAEAQRIRTIRNVGYVFAAAGSGT